MTHFTIHKQTWPSSRLTRYILSCEEGTVTLGIYSEPQTEQKIQAYICNLWVKEEYRRQGIANALLTQAETIAKDAGMDAVFLHWCAKDSEQHVLKWYTRHGYDDVAFNRDGTEVRLKKEL